MSHPQQQNILVVVVVSVNQVETQKSLTQNWNTDFYIGFMLVLTSASLHELLGYYGKKSVSKQIINLKRPDVLNSIIQPNNPKLKHV